MDSSSSVTNGAVASSNPPNPSSAPTRWSRKRRREMHPTEPKQVEAPRKEPKAHSSFVELRRSLSDAASVSGFITAQQNTGLRDSRQVNAFLQALSHCPTELLHDLCAQHKRCVHLALERMFELYGAGKVPMSPASHEFVLRCEQHGVRRAEWAIEMTDTVQTQSHTETNTHATEETVSSHPLLSARELLKKLAALDPRGRMERRIELCTNPTDLQSCVRKLFALTDTFPYAAMCQMVSKLASKARRVGGAALDASARPAFAEMFAALLELTQRTLAARPPLSAQQPIAKLVHLSRWGAANGLLGDSHSAAVAALEARAAEDVRRQTAQLEAVMRLKALPPGNAAAAADALEEMWCAERGHFAPYSADVLSSIAVIAGGLSERPRALVAERLARTQQTLREKGVQLPRRAMRLVNAEQSRVKQESIRRILAEEGEEEGSSGNKN